MKNKIKTLWKIILVIFILFILSYTAANIVLDLEFSAKDKIAVINIEGTISSGTGSGLLSEISASPTTIIEDLKKAEADESIKGIIIQINSPGGTVVASEEIENAIKALKKPKYAVMTEVAASGGYWIASAADKIYASPMTITGSIGVIGSYLEFSKLFEEYGVTYQRLVGGKYKDMGSVYKNLTEKEKEIFQSKLDKIHSYFIAQVAENRNMTIANVTALATGEFYLGEEALIFGLIDNLGTKEDAITAMKEQLNLTKVEIVNYKHKTSILDLFGIQAPYYFGKGFGSEFSNKIETSTEFNIKV